MQILPGGVGSQHIEAQYIGSELGYNLLRLDDVAYALGHLPALVIQSEAVHENALVGRSSKGDHGSTQLRVEPAARLVVALGDEVRRPPIVELFFVAGVAQGCPGGHSAVKPDIEDVRGTFHLATAWTVQEDKIDIRPVQIIELLAASLLQLCSRAYHIDMAADGAGPDGQRNSPVPLPGDAPVTGIANPVREPG